MLSDPVYAELVAYFKNGGVAAVNVNADSFDALCIELTAFPATSLPDMTATGINATEKALASIYSLMTTYIDQLQEMYQTVTDIVNLLSPTDSSITIDVVETNCLEVLLPDFTVSYLTPWLVRAQQIPPDPTLPEDMQAFYDLQVANLVAYQQDLVCANQALAVMSNASNASAQAMMPPNLRAILSKILQLLMPFGQIGLTPGQEYKQSKKNKSASPSSDSPAPNAGSSAPSDTPTPPERPMGNESGAVAPSNVG